jgi:hypothetical protein
MNPFSLKGILMNDSVYFLQDYLQKLPAHSKIYLQDEPIYMYGTSHSPPLNCLAILLDDPRLLLDADFIARHIYWMPESNYDWFLQHPRCKMVIQKERFFMQHFDKKYPDGEFFGMGPLARTYYKASKIIDTWNQRRQYKYLAFTMIPFLRRWIKQFKISYYSIGGKGYILALNRFGKQVRESELRKLDASRNS